MQTIYQLFLEINAVKFGHSEKQKEIVKLFSNVVFCELVSEDLKNHNGLISFYLFMIPEEILFTG